MSLPYDQSFFVLDIETGGELLERGGESVAGFFEASERGRFVGSAYHTLHSNHPLLQVDVYRGGAFAPIGGPGGGYVRPPVGAIASTFSLKKGTWERAMASSMTEEEAAHRVFEELAAHIGQHKPAIVSGYHPLYDLSFIETLTWRYPSLSAYRGKLAEWRRLGQLKIQELEEPFLRLALAFGQQHKEFAEKFFRMGPNTPITPAYWPGKLAETFEEMKFVPGWGQENIVRALGGQRFLKSLQLLYPYVNLTGLHEARTDIIASIHSYELFQRALQKVEAGVDIETALQGALPDIGLTAESFFRSVYRPFETAAGAITTKSVARAGSRIKGKYWAIAAGATLLSALLASSRVGKPAHHITGLQDIGLAPEGRHARTDFGSGYQGLDKSPTLTTAEYMLAAGVLYGTHRYLLRAVPEYGKTLFSFFRTLEERSPAGILKTFSLGDIFSAYIPSTLHYEPGQLISKGTGLYTELGAHFQRLTGLGKEQMRAGLTFERVSTAEPYMRLKEAPGVSVRFARQGRLVTSSARYGAPLRPAPPMPKTYMSLDQMFNLKAWSRAFEALKETQRGRRLQGIAWSTFEGEKIGFQPLYVRRGPGAAKQVASRLDTLRRVLFELAERPQRLMTEAGVGLKAGSYNKVFNFPFVGKGGLINQLLLKRVLPAYLAYTGLRWLDYKTGHRASDAIAGLPLHANILRAELTDFIPGLRKVTDFYARNVPGPQYGPLALPAGGAFLGAALHYAHVLQGRFQTEAVRKAALSKYGKVGALIGAALMLPLLPGMIGSRKTADELRRIYSGEEEIPVRAGRWWEVGSTPFWGGRIKYFRPHWYARMKARSEAVSLWGSEEEYWRHHPLLHPIRAFTHPYELEERNYWQRPYPVTSPAFSNVPLIGPILAATIGKIVKPPRYMHQGEWSPEEYTLYSPRLEPKEGGLPPARARDEYGLMDVLKREAYNVTEFIGLPGFIAQSLWQRIHPPQPGGPPMLQGSRQMTNISRRYYEKELGALIGITPSADIYGFSEPLRRFIQPERLGAQVNEIPNQMPSWLPGEDYYTNFRVGDIYARIPEGYMRLPGAGYEALHPELQGLKPEEYPDLTKLRILADVAPYSRQYESMRVRMQAEARRDTNLAIEVDRVTQQVERLKKSTIQLSHRRFTEEVQKIRGTIKAAGPTGVLLEEYPGRTFQFSALGMSMSDMSAVVLGEQNALTRTQMVQEVERRQQRRDEFIANYLQPGTQVFATVPVGAVEHAPEIQAVLETRDININRALINQGLARLRPEEAGAEYQAMEGPAGRVLGTLAESLAFAGDQSMFNPMRYIPTPFGTKLWQMQTPLARYQEEEIYGNRMRRWDRPLHDFLMPYLRGMTHRLTGQNLMPAEVQHKRNLNELADVMKYLRGIQSGSAMQAARTAMGANLFAEPSYVMSTLPRREQLYFADFLNETNPDKRREILDSVAPETARALQAQWVTRDASILRAEGKRVPPIGEGGRLYTPEDVEDYERAQTDLTYGQYVRSREIAEFFARTGWAMPEAGADAYNPAIDYEDLKVKMLMQEGYNLHDFNLYDDRANTVWRKPYLDGAIRELTSGGNRSVENIRRTVERLMLDSQGGNPKVIATGHPSNQPINRVNVTFDEHPENDMLRDIQRNREEYAVG
jgi:hypothetical protein